ncbi:MAG: HIT family protein [archaeon]|nr:HIT family protein [Nanoarchaeota archaeon]
MADNCVFCAIARKEMSGAYEVYRDDNFVAFLDIRSLNKGHTLVVPIKHYRWVWDVKENYSKVVNKVANAIKKAFGVDYVFSMVMGEEVPHAHIHLIPRFKDDGHGVFLDASNVKDYSEEKMQEFQGLIKKALS